MKEKDLNTIIVKSLKSVNGFAHKISDDAGNFRGTSRKPFDYFGVTDRFIIYGESKLLKPLKAFPFSSLEEHQHESMDLISRLSHDRVLPVVTVGAWEPRKYFYVFVFHYDYIRERMKSEKSIKKKELQRLIDAGKALSIKKGLIENVERMDEYVIRNYSESFEESLTKHGKEEV